MPFGKARPAQGAVSVPRPRLEGARGAECEAVLAPRDVALAAAPLPRTFMNERRPLVADVFPCCIIFGPDPNANSDAATAVHNIHHTRSGAQNCRFWKWCQDLQVVLAMYVVMRLEVG